MKHASSLDRKATSPGMSSGCPRRLSGIDFRKRSYSFCPYSPSPRNECSNAVSVGPGHTTLTLMLLRAYSRAIVFENAINPPLHAEYTASPEDPTRPASEAML